MPREFQHVEMNNHCQFQKVAAFHDIFLTLQGCAADAASA
jgi:hypothetical protein